ncbi:MAG: DUF99 family protein [Candidatus Woesearchaeota archaeon]
MKKKKSFLKKEIRVIGIDDAPFDKFKEKENLVIGTIYRGGDFMDGVLSTHVQVDGDDSTHKISMLINNSKFKSQLRCILLDGIALSGFNVIDIKELKKKTRLPVMVIMRHYPDIDKIKNALEKVKKPEKMILIEKAGKIHEINGLFVQLAGMTMSKAKEILEITCTRSQIPEPIRMAHIIASGVKDGESRGRA